MSLTSNFCSNCVKSMLEWGFYLFSKSNIINFTLNHALRNSPIFSWPEEVATQLIIALKARPAMALFTGRRTLARFLSRTLSQSFSSSSLLASSRSRFAFALIDKHSPPLVSNSARVPTRLKTSGSGYSPLNDPSPNWSNRPPKETILLDGCDYEHWLIVMEFPNDSKPSEDEMIAAYVKTLAAVVGRYVCPFHSLLSDCYGSIFYVLVFCLMFYCVFLVGF